MVSVCNAKKPFEVQLMVSSLAMMDPQSLVKHLRHPMVHVCWETARVLRVLLTWVRTWGKRLFLVCNYSQTLVRYPILQVTIPSLNGCRSTQKGWCDQWKSFCCASFRIITSSRLRRLPPPPAFFFWKKNCPMKTEKWPILEIPWFQLLENWSCYCFGGLGKGKGEHHERGLYWCLCPDSPLE